MRGGGGGGGGRGGGGVGAVAWKKTKWRMDFVNMGTEVASNWNDLKQCWKKSKLTWLHDFGIHSI